MTDHTTLAWGPTARKGEPHQFLPGPQGWCAGCDYAENAYVHASEEDRRVFDLKTRRDAALAVLRRNCITVEPGSCLDVEQIEALAEVVKDWEG